MVVPVAAVPVAVIGRYSYCRSALIAALVQEKQAPVVIWLPLGSLDFVREVKKGSSAIDEVYIEVHRISEGIQTSLIHDD